MRRSNDRLQTNENIFFLSIRTLHLNVDMYIIEIYLSRKLLNVVHFIRGHLHKIFLDRITLDILTLSKSTCHV